VAILQQKPAYDCMVATGSHYTVRTFLEKAFDYLQLD
jgi:GDP-D-mannose dehydratase